LIVLGIVLISAVAIFIFSGEDSVEIPEKLFGRWTTADPKYADRFFDLSKNSVVFGVGNGNIAVYTTDDIYGIIEDDRIIYTVIFVDDEGVEYSQSLYFSKNDDNLLFFKNQNKIGWRKHTE
jgi:hypothetical protein